ncbi:hypothetical protein P7C70_g1728, partial [Phenoliferia sp. Uapishka_3]
MQPSVLPTNVDDGDHASDAESCSSFTSAFVKVRRSEGDDSASFDVGAGLSTPSDSGEEWTFVEETSLADNDDPTTPSAHQPAFPRHGKGRASSNEGYGDIIATREEPSSQTDERVARALQERDDADLARRLFDEEDSGGVDSDSEDNYDNESEEERDEVGGPRGLTVAQLLSLLPLSQDRRARISAGVARESPLPGSIEPDQPRDRTRWVATQHPSSKVAQIRFDYDEDYASTFALPSVSRSEKRGFRIPKGTPGTFCCPLCDDTVGLADPEAISVFCPLDHQYCRSCLSSYVRSQVLYQELAEITRRSPIFCIACRRRLGNVTKVFFFSYLGRSPSRPGVRGPTLPGE